MSEAAIQTFTPRATGAKGAEQSGRAAVPGIHLSAADIEAYMDKIEQLRTHETQRYQVRALRENPLPRAQAQPQVAIRTIQKPATLPAANQAESAPAVAVRRDSLFTAIALLAPELSELAQAAELEQAALQGVS